jgi:hypothetical protein
MLPLRGGEGGDGKSFKAEDDDDDDDDDGLDDETFTDEYDEYDDEVSDTESTPAASPRSSASSTTSAQNRNHPAASSSFSSSSFNHKNHRQPQQQPQQQYRRKNPPTPQSSSSLAVFSQLAGRSGRLTNTIVTETLKTSGKAAHYLISPKHVERNELLGLWRIDQQINTVTTSRNIELTKNNDVVVGVTESQHNAMVSPTSSNKRRRRTDDEALQQQQSSSSTPPWKFIPSKWPRPARVEFWIRQSPYETNHGNESQSIVLLLLYVGTVHRKLAARHVLKLKGTIYQIIQESSSKSIFGKSNRPNGPPQKKKKILVGTFVARKRIRISEQEEDDDNDDHYSEDKVHPNNSQNWRDNPSDHDEDSDGYDEDEENESNGIYDEEE